ncbi:MAG: excisionase, partial [Plesiomonas shigelloides]
LYSWAKNGFIQPSPQKAGRRWFVEPDALYVGQLVQPEIPTTSNPVLKRIFANGPSA